MGGAQSAAKWDSLTEVDKSEVDQQILLFLQRALLRYQETTLTVRIFRAFGLAVTDSPIYGTSDPFVTCHIKGKESEMVKTTTKVDTVMPSWSTREGTLVLPNVTGLDELEITVREDDSFRKSGELRGSDLLGKVTFGTEGLSSGGDSRTINVDLEDGEKTNFNGNYGELSLRWSREITMPDIREGSDRETVEKAFFALIPSRFEAQVRTELEAEVVKVLDNFQAPPAAATTTTPAVALTPAPSAADADATAAAAEPVPAPVPTPPPAPVGPVVRKEIRTLSDMEQQRFVDAIFKLMEKQEGQTESEWFRLASYHGWPANDGQGYCAHRAEHFPGWHRAYLLDFELALQKADILNGNDGRIALPYWDFSKVRVNGQIMPLVIRMNFGEKFRFPSDFFDSVAGGSASVSSSAAQFMRTEFSRIASESALERSLMSGRVPADAVNCMNMWENHEHWLFASTENTRGVPVEQPHNMTHNALGYPLTSLRYAAFHPMFWLLHCHVDRLLSSYVQNTPGRKEECIAEMLAHQRLASQRGLTDVSKVPLEPFTNPSTAQPFMLVDTFETRPLGYVYDSLVSPPAPRLTAPPTYVLFRGVDVVRNLIDKEGTLKSFSLHIFLVPIAAMQGEGKGLVGVPVDGKVNEFASHQYYAGVAAAFGGKGPKCKNCAETKPINIKFEVSAKLADLGVQSRHDVVVKVITEDELGNVVALENLSSYYGPSCKIPNPIMVGPLFDENTPDLKLAPETKNSYTIQLQQYLKRFGYYSGEVDGLFGEKTDNAVKLYQQMNGLVSDGVAGEITKSRMVSPMNDGDAHVVPTDAAPRFASGSEVKYWIGENPGYLPAESVATAIKAALDEWAAACTLTFTKVDKESDITDGTVGVKFIFGVSVAETAEQQAQEDTERDGTANIEEQEIANFDGPGGTLARAEGAVVRFDTAERWSATAAGCKTSRHFNLQAVALHEVGHVLGLSHSTDPLDVMGPYYSKNRTKLSTGDKNRAKTLFAK